MPRNPNRTERIVTDLNEIQEPSNRWLASLSPHPVIVDENGTYRFQETIDDTYIDLNKRVIDYKRGKISRDDQMEFYRCIGYSLDGYWDVFYRELGMIEREQGLNQPVEEIEEECYDSGDVAQQFENLAKKVAEYDPDESEVPDLSEVVKMLRLAAYFYRGYNKDEVKE